jgi:hypothetical protein
VNPNLDLASQDVRCHPELVQEASAGITRALLILLKVMPCEDEADAGVPGT